jgi:hypothetical protein
MTVPGYWMNETSGVLEPVVRKYLEGAELSTGEVGTMRAYLRQWMAGDFHGPEIEWLRLDVYDIRTTVDLRAWLARAFDAGIDPL